MIALLFLILLPFLCRLPEDLALASTWPRDSPGPRDVGGWTASELRAQTARALPVSTPPSCASSLPVTRTRSWPWAPPSRSGCQNEHIYGRAFPTSPLTRGPEDKGSPLCRRLMHTMRGHCLVNNRNNDKTYLRLGCPLSIYEMRRMPSS